MNEYGIWSELLINWVWVVCAYVSGIKFLDIFESLPVAGEVNSKQQEMF